MLDAVGTMGEGMVVGGGVIVETREREREGEKMRTCVHFFVFALDTPVSRSWKYRYDGWMDLLCTIIF